MTENIKNYDFVQYQLCRKNIPYYKYFWQLKQAIAGISQYLLEDSWIGLLREWRAFWYLKKNTKFGFHLMISDSKKDLNGIDLISYDHNWKQKFTFQVTGFTNQKSNADYIIKVDKKIYIFKNKEKNVNNTKM